MYLVRLGYVPGHARVCDIIGSTKHVLLKAIIRSTRVGYVLGAAFMYVQDHEINITPRAVSWPNDLV